jgi:hypothetical protein
MNSSINLIERSLFSGAITCELPKDWYDLSNLRQIPDHQECYCYDDATTNSTSIWVMEILERQQDIDDEDIVQYLFRDLAESNGCSKMEQSTNFRSNDVVQCNMLPNLLKNSTTPMICRSGSGIQHIQPGMEDLRQQAETVLIELVVVRLRQYNTELLVTLSVPTMTTSNDHNIDSVLIQSQKDLFQQILSTIQLHDYTLFG